MYFQDKPLTGLTVQFRGRGRTSNIGLTRTCLVSDVKLENKKRLLMQGSWTQLNGDDVIKIIFEEEEFYVEQ